MQPIVSMPTLDLNRELTHVVCNPFGGLGLTGGIVDIGGLYDCLLGIYEGKADADILDKYSEIRRQKYKEIVDVVSQDNIRRLFDQDPDQALEKDEFLKMLNRIKGNQEEVRDFLLAPNGLKHDFTQYYKQANGTSEVNGVKGSSAHVEAVAAVGAD
jgi:hypothetical protein